MFGRAALPEPDRTDGRPYGSRSRGHSGPGRVKAAAAYPKLGCNQLQTQHMYTVRRIL